ncbi:beta-propeller fold lactonase family protein [Variovorax sp. PAMC26660]|uniref:beta-propeller fold lactonase family protein n=1 Tax=Variovorax sp. PAMC26660 TaxID=2762322 RepID=UPI00164D6009|nr:beta-propeller fold lactonase family protein [Variovorax sp. PAMC26660]QNK66567.1 beta-propeller fold lactonase family protein [Variovorax sp. PAMC26660]
MPTLLLSSSHARALFSVLGNACTFLRNAIARAALMALFVLVGGVLAGCGGSGSGSGSGGLPFLPVTPPVTPPPPPGATYPVSGTVAGLQGSGLVLQNNAGDDLPVAADGVVRFAVPVASGARYAVTVKAQPTNSAQTCTVNNGSGTVVDVAIADVAVVCSVNSYKVGGAVTGLQGGGLVLQNNAGDDQSVAADGAFEFTAPVASAAGYAVTVKTQPTAPSQTCTVNNASATVGDADVKTVQVICATNSYTISGTISGLRGRGLVLQNNAGDDLALSYSVNGTFSFTTPVASAAGYAVTVKTQPQFLNQVCTVSNGRGTVVSAAVTSVGVSCVSSAPSARFAYVANQASDTVSAYTVDATTGALSAMVPPTVPAPGQPYALTVDPTSRFAYVANINSNTVSAYTIDSATGALSLIAGPAVPTGISPISVTVDPTGRFAYVANLNSNTVSAYAIDAITGALSPMAVPTVPTGGSPYVVTVEPTGRFAYVANAGSRTVSAYTIDTATGALSPMAVSTVPTGGSPYTVTVEPTGRFVYVANADSDTVSTYTIDAATGALSPVAEPTVATGRLPSAVAVDPTGRFAYVANWNSDTVSTYTIDAATGRLSPMAGLTVPTGNRPYAVTVDPSGRFAYLANVGSNTVSAYTIDAATGALSPMAPPTAAAGLFPRSIALSR